MKTEQPVRMSKCFYRHRETKVVNGVKYGMNYNGRQSLWGNFPAIAPSSPDLPFFKSKSDSEYDEHFCGCMGWS